MEFETVLEQCLPKMRKLASIMIGEQDAEDLVQDTCVAALESDWRFNQLCEPYTWLVSIMRNQYFQTLRRNKIRRTRPLLNRLRIEAPIPVDSDRAAWLAIRLLSKAHRAVIVKHFYDGMTYEEIARAEGVPRGTIASRISEAKQRMKRGFDEHLHS